MEKFGIKFKTGFSSTMKKFKCISCKKDKWATDQNAIICVKCKIKYPNGIDQKTIFDFIK